MITYTQRVANLDRAVALAQSGRLTPIRNANYDLAAETVKAAKMFDEHLDEDGSKV